MEEIIFCVLAKIKADPAPKIAVKLK